MLDTYTGGTIEIAGVTHEAEAEFEWYEGKPVVYRVFAIRQTAKKGEVWYDRNAQPHWGPHWGRLDVTDWVSIPDWVDEIAESGHAQHKAAIARSYRYKEDA